MFVLHKLWDFKTCDKDQKENSTHGKELLT
jgi:hypothetical protein